MIDTHTHIYGPEFDIPGQEAGSMAGQLAAVDRAVEAGVTRMVLANVDKDSISPIAALAALRPDEIITSIGLHPTELGEDYRATLSGMESLLDSGDYKAVGEIGIDLYWDKSRLDDQMDAFSRQLQWARARKLPVLIHSREALEPTLEVLKDFLEVSAVFHSFGGTPEDVERIRRVGDYYFGINGIVTFKNSKLADTLPAIGIERILTETDAPYLAPAPHRGKRNESAMIPLIVQRISEALNLPFKEIDDVTTANALKFLNIRQ